MSKFDSDSKMTVKEEAEIMDWKTVITTREVIADKMITVSTCFSVKTCLCRQIFFMKYML